ncbi:pyridoxal 5'-phosphate synthase [Micromonospora sp. RHAY321]|uniref:pyridoxine/pyridoxamine 5'-phosphate oxidase n=1 Tax=Micromonospora sp. RHAY321 TaxID=2944807 RepID=UPI00207C1E16|nr:pyridoxal 5'-phosphate synthase [Micromonospora sp. RHAY321]MCO1599364.1 pyridoxal 5'-phosphate synthase [Micromonospora sp. RHAY321]
MSIRDLLRGLPVFARPLPRFAPDDAPDRPDDLFVSWLDEAIAAGVVEPHAMTLSTVDADGRPDTRVLLLKDLDDRGWQFATDADSAKGRQVAGQPAAALGFYWREQARQVRVRGSVTPLDSQTSAGDFLDRPVGSRVASLASRQSEVLDDPADLGHALAAAEEAVRDDPQVLCASHTVYAVTPVTVEFWQGDAERRHVRLRYRRVDDAWVKEMLWP